MVLCNSSLNQDTNLSRVLEKHNKIIHPINSRTDAFSYITKERHYYE